VYVGTDGLHQDEFLRGDHLTTLFRVSIAPPSLEAAIINAKYVNSNPLDRIARDFQTNGLNLSKQTMSNWTVWSAERYFLPVYNRMRSCQLEAHVNQCDETPLEVIHDDRPAGSKNYMWVHITGELNPVPQIVVYALRIQLQDNSQEHLSFEERLGYLVDVEYTSRKNNRLHRLIQRAYFDQPQANIADINYTSERKLDKSLINRLSTGDYIADVHKIIIMGASGTGKSYLACTFGVEACKQYYTVKYLRLPDLLADINTARDLGTYKKLMNSYSKYKLLILDEWLLTGLTDTEAKDSFELIHARHKRTSTIFCSQFSPQSWHKKIGEATLADAILDRILHDSYTIEIQADANMREVYGLKNIKSIN
jgi:DNA replication protein DnaC